MPMSMRETIARAMIWKAGGVAGDELPPELRNHFFGCADRVITALETPTQAMLRAVESGDAEGVWSAMVQAMGE